MKEKIKKILFILATILFVITFCFYELFILIQCIYAFFYGTTTGFIESLGNHKMYYGLEAVQCKLELWLILTIGWLWPIPLYQIIYLIIYYINYINRVNRQIEAELKSL